METNDLSQLRNSTLPIFYIIGYPASGKKTQCSKLQEMYGFSHFRIGDLLRFEIQDDLNDLGKTLEAGETVSEDVALKVLVKAMTAEVAKGTKGFLLDGFPRNLKQAELFEKEVGPCTLALYMDMDLSGVTMLRRAAATDMRQLKNRAIRFQKQTLPLVEYYDKHRKLERIPADKDEDQVFKVLQLVMQRVFRKAKYA